MADAGGQAPDSPQPDRRAALMQEVADEMDAIEKGVRRRLPDRPRDHDRRGDQTR